MDSSTSSAAATAATASSITQTAAHHQLAALDTDSSMLREWNYPQPQPQPQPQPSTSNDSVETRNHNSSRDTATSRATTVAVPVAPAVVLSSETPSSELVLLGNDSDNSYDYETNKPRYPVATFVSNLVRRNIDSFHDSIHGGGAAYAIAADDDDAGQHASVRSDSIVRGVREDTMRSVATAATHTSGDDEQYIIPTLDEAEFVIVDGDLVELPSPERCPSLDNENSNNENRNNNEQENDDDFTTHYNSRRRQRRQQNSSKMRQRLKGIRKWIKKRATRMVQDEQQKKAAEKEQRDNNINSQDSNHHHNHSKRNGKKRGRPKRGGEQQQQHPDEDDAENDLSQRQQQKESLSSFGESQQEFNMSREGLAAPAASSPSRRDLLYQQQQQHSVASLPSSYHEQQHVAAAAAAPISPTPLSAVVAMPLHQHQHRHHHDNGPVVVDDVSREGSATTPTTTVNADFIGSVEQVLESGLLTNVAAAVAFVEQDPKDDWYYGGKKDSALKQEEMVLDTMLQQARHESDEEEGIPELAMETIVTASTLKKPPQAKVDVDSKPLSEATTLDRHVWNDTLKVVLVGGTDADEKSALGRALAGKRPKRPKSSLGVDVHTWTPDLKFSIWDIHSVHAGAHPATQSLFFSGASLYVLLWDLTAGGSLSSLSSLSQQQQQQGTTRGRTRTLEIYDDDDDEDDDDEEDNEFMKEELLRAAYRALELDIQDNLLSWLDHVAYAGSAILPVVTIPGHHDLPQAEIQRRCSLLQVLLMNHPAFEGEGAPNLIFGDNDSIVRLCLETGQGLPKLQEMIHAIGKEKVFPHVGTPVDPVVVEVNQTIRRLKKDHKVIMLDHLMSEMKSRMHVEQVQEALYFLSNIGEVLYYGNSTDEILSRYVILSRKWLVSALSCILRPDLQRELDETRRFMNLQCVYSGEAFNESDIVQTLLQGTNSSCPILSAKDSAMLWQSMSFMREAADRTAQLSEASNTMYDFLERLLVHTGIFMPLTVSAEPTYFVPSLLDTAATAGVWTYKSSESWMTTLCHSWLLRDGAPSNIMEHVTTCLLQDLYEFSNTFHGATVRPLEHAKTYPMGPGSFTEFVEAHDNEAIGRIKIHQVMCWKSCMLVKIGTVFADAGHAELRESFSEIFVALVDEQSEYCVATRDMSNSTKRLIVCGKGQVGHHGRKLWKGGFSLVLDSLRASLADATGCHREVVCPECLAHSHPSVAGTWSWETVIAANETGNAGVRCNRGHLVDTNLLCGLCNVAPPKPPPESHTPPRLRKPVSKLLNSVVVVGLWDSYSQEIRSVGSGFMVDKKLGLVVTAGHILFDMAPGRTFGTQYFGLRNAKAVIGVIQGDGPAVFRYFAELVAHDICNVDACVLRITTKLEQDVDGDTCGGQPEIPLSNMRNERLTQLKMTRTFELEESVRILGFNQGGEGVLEQGKHVNRSADFAKGYICKRFTNLGSDDSSTSSRGSSSSAFLKDPPLPADMPLSSSFVPREEIVVMCPTISGHSGGPCVNDEGRVVGILSRADPVDRQRCYLVPTTELKDLVSRAKLAIRRSAYGTSSAGFTTL